MSHRTRVEETLGAPQAYGVTPTKAARRIEERTNSAVWDVDPQTWERVVEPAIARMRALPEPDVRLMGETRTRILVFELSCENSRATRTRRSRPA